MSSDPQHPVHEQVPHFRDYVSFGKVSRLNLLADVQTNIAILHFEIAWLEADLVRAKAVALQASKEPSATARNQKAFIETAEPEAVIIELRARLAALVEEKFFLIRLSDILDTGLV